jgi:uncharacterized protein
MEPNQDRALIPQPSRELAAPQIGANRILGEMVENSLALAKQIAPADVDLDALVREGKRIQRREGMTPDDIRAFQLFFQAGTAKQAEAQYLVSECFSSGYGTAKDGKVGFEWLRRSAESGFAYAQCVLSFRYREGVGVPKDYAEAVKWLRNAAEQGSASGQCGLGFFYDMGWAVPQDVAQAANWYRKAAEQGHAVGQYNVGLCCEKGRGVPQDYVEAAVWYRKAAEQVFARGQAILSSYRKQDQQDAYRTQLIQQSQLNSYFEKARNAAHDNAEAAKWYRKATEQSIASFLMKA